MLVRFFGCLLLGVVVSLAGCSGSKESPAASGPSAESPSGTSGAPAPAALAVNPQSSQECVRMFLEAVRTGDDKTSSALLTKLAREKTAEMNLQVAPPGSATASFEVGEVKPQQSGTEEGAYVASKWTDVGEDGKPHTDEIVWITVKDPEGWRIVGMGITVFADLEPVYLNFEDPQDMLRKQQFVEQEMQRRATAAQSQAGAPGSQTVAVPGNSPSGQISGQSGASIGAPPTQAQLPSQPPATQLK